jgi:hypothetical protein
MLVVDSGLLHDLHAGATRGAKDRDVHDGLLLFWWPSVRVAGSREGDYLGGGA